MTETLSESCRRLAPPPDRPTASTSGLRTRIPTWTLLIAVVIAAAAIFGVVRAYDSAAGGARQAGAAYQQTNQNIKQATTITMNEYAAIQTGMTLPQVQHVMKGWPGTQTESSAVGGQTGSTYQWQDADAEITVLFQNGAVSTKGQYGL